ncbi:unnamed protein product [Polarella glacialis]|uniref:Uncharacterized protein n=1 Tax=Polarella glacialis TaxID=89957 RepID=A0A813EC39_POLGL|nr:unnamed protein product [Polarella glacialis]
MFNMLVTTKDENQKGLIELHGFLLALKRAAGNVGTGPSEGNAGTSEGTTTPAVAAVAAGAPQFDQGFLNDLYQLLAAAGNPQLATAQSQQVGTSQPPSPSLLPTSLFTQLQAAAAGFLAPTAGVPQLAAAQSQHFGTYQNPQQAAAAGYLAAIAGVPQQPAAQSKQVGTYPHPQQAAAAGYLAAIAGVPQQPAAQSKQVGTYPRPQQTAAAGYLAPTAGNPQRAAVQSQQVGTYQRPQQTAATRTIMGSTSFAASPGQYPMQPSASHMQYQPAQVQNNLDQEPFHQEGSNHSDAQLVLARKKGPGKPSGHGTSRANSKIPKVPTEQEYKTSRTKYCGC